MTSTRVESQRSALTLGFVLPGHAQLAVLPSSMWRPGTYGASAAPG